MRITDLHITNFRSLRKLDLKGLRQVNVLYGENNVGKSNVLAAIDMILRTKNPSRGPQQGEVVFKNSFLQGDIWHFDDNFCGNDKSKLITFRLGLRFTPDEIVSHLFKRVDPTKVLSLAAGTVSIAGDVSYVGTTETSDTTGDIAYFETRQVCWEDTRLYDADAKPDPFLPDGKVTFLGLDAAGMKELCEQIGALATNSFQLVGSSRYLGEELTVMGSHDLRPGNVKNALLQWSQGVPDRSWIEVFHEVHRLFSSEPFGYGLINPCVVPAGTQSRADLLVKKNDLWLPIDHLGTGAQQALILLAHLASKRDRPIMGIEELELNLSPGKQEAILGQLATAAADPRFPLDQVFLTSHSSVFAGDDTNRVIMLQMKNGETVVLSGADSIAEFGKYQEPARKECPYCSAWKLVKGAEDSNALQDADDAEWSPIQTALKSTFCEAGCDKRVATAKRMATERGLTWPT